jgi:anti-sigma factor RsiW
MKTDGCREWRESLGAHALGHLADDERAGLEAHLEGCPNCRAELEQLAALAGPLSLADPARFESSPVPPAALAARVAAAIGRERLAGRRRRTRLGLAFAGAAAAAIVVAALVVLPGGGGPTEPEQHVTFASLPAGMKISAKLIPHSYGTEIHMYVKGISSGTLCRVYLLKADGTRLPAGSYRYRWGEDALAVLSAGLDLSETDAMQVRVGKRVFKQEV